MEKLNTSRINLMLKCNRAHFLRYEIGIETTSQGQALRFGSAFHRALAARATGSDYQAALAAGIGPTQDLNELDIAILAGLLCGYYDHYKTDPIKELHPEVELSAKMDGNRSFHFWATLDGLATLNDSRLALVEHKTTSESLDSDSGYWDALKFNAQVIGYVDIARENDWPLDTVIYDVVKKPTIRQKQTETVMDFAMRLKDDTRTRPEFYYARREVPVLDADIAEYKAMRDCVARQITAARIQQKRYDKPSHAWPRCVGRFTCSNCEYSSFCLQGIEASREQIPSGFKLRADNSH